MGAGRPSSGAASSVCSSLTRPQLLQVLCVVRRADDVDGFDALLRGTRATQKRRQSDSRQPPQRRPRKPEVQHPTLFRLLLSSLHQPTFFLASWITMRPSVEEAALESSHSPCGDEDGTSAQAFSSSCAQRHAGNPTASSQSPTAQKRTLGTRRTSKKP